MHQEQVKKFNQTHPDIRVKIEFSEGGTMGIAKIFTTIAGGNPPDLIYMDRANTASMKSRGALLPLNSYLKEIGIDIEREWFPATLWTVKYRGQIYAIPKEALPCTLIYWNKDLYREVGLDPEVSPTTIAQLDQYADKLSRWGANGELERIGFLP